MLEWFVELFGSCSVPTLSSFLSKVVEALAASDQGALRDGFGGRGGLAGLGAPASRPASANDPAEEELDEEIDVLLEILSDQGSRAVVDEELAVDPTVSSNDC
jgi:hypothetical protein|mmetsp:Transcript_17541/g.28488  ORF Transcript_17541/g.28488 Transcript_17541/m.28488 type:complete len:103 (-) Transcript_17541:193-501(-)